MPQVLISQEEEIHLLKLLFLINLEFQNLNLELFLNQEITKVLNQEQYQVHQDLEVKKHNREISINREMKVILQHLEILILEEVDQVVLELVVVLAAAEDLAAAAEEVNH